MTFIGNIGFFKTVINRAKKKKTLTALQSILFCAFTLPYLIVLNTNFAVSRDLIAYTTILSCLKINFTKKIAC